MEILKNLKNKNKLKNIYSRAFNFANLWHSRNYWHANINGDKVLHSLIGGKLRGVQALMCMSLIQNIIAIAVFIPWVSCGDTRMKEISAKLLGFIGFGLCISSGKCNLI